MMVNAQDYPIKSVVVFRSAKAEVVRTFTIVLKKGQNEIVLEKLPSCIDVDSVQVQRLKDATWFDISTRVTPHSLFEPEHDDLHPTKPRHLRELEEDKEVLLGQRRMRDLEAITLVNYANTMNAGNTEPKKMLKFLSDLYDYGIDNQGYIAEINKKAAEVDKKIEAANVSLSKAETEEDPLRASATLLLLAQKDGKVTFDLSYVVSQAQWGPIYDLRASTENDAPLSEIMLHFRASVRQTTGEDWNDVALTLSTVEANVDTALPPMYELKLQAIRERTGEDVIREDGGTLRHGRGFGQVGLMETESISNKVTLGGNSSSKRSDISQPSNTPKSDSRENQTPSASPTEKYHNHLPSSQVKKEEDQAALELAKDLPGKLQAPPVSTLDAMAGSLAFGTSKSKSQQAQISQTPTTASVKSSSSELSNDFKGQLLKKPSTEIPVPGHNYLSPFPLLNLTRSDPSHKIQSSQFPLFSSATTRQPNLFQKSGTEEETARRIQDTLLAVKTEISQLQSSQASMRRSSVSKASENAGRLQDTAVVKGTDDFVVVPSMNGKGLSSSNSHNPSLSQPDIVDRSSISASYQVEGASTIPSDQTPHRVWLAALKLESESQYIAVPKVKQTAFVDCHVKNISQHHILPGPMTVYMNERYITKTSIPHIAPGGSFSCSLGPDGNIGLSYIHKAIKQSPGTSKFATWYDTYSHIITIKAINKGQFPISQLTLRDMIPITEDERIKIALVEPAKLKEAKGSDLVNVKENVKIRWTKLLDGSAAKQHGWLEWLCTNIPANGAVEVQLQCDITAPSDAAVIDKGTHELQRQQKAFRFTV